MKVELKNGNVIEIDDTLYVETQTQCLTAKVAELEREVERLKKENEVLVDAASSNIVLRKNVEKSKKICAFQRTSASVYRGACRALWKHLEIKLTEIDDDGMRRLVIYPKDDLGERVLENGSIDMPIPAERAYGIAQVFKADGTFPNREDIMQMVFDRAKAKKLRVEADDDEEETDD